MFVYPGVSVSRRLRPRSIGLRVMEIIGIPRLALSRTPLWYSTHASGSLLSEMYIPVMSILRDLLFIELVSWCCTAQIMEQTFWIKVHITAQLPCWKCVKRRALCMDVINASIHLLL